MIDILIPTLRSRAEQFDFILNKLKKQIGDLPVNVLWELDSGENTTGHKRNNLLNRANSKYACFLDDDDDISETYIKHLWAAANSGMDCASLGGLITFDGIGARPFVHSIQYDHYFETGLMYCRPPNHLNLIKTEISKQFTFPDVSLSEDTDWAMQIARENVLKTEYAIPEIIYFYKYITKK